MVNLWARLDYRNWFVPGAINNPCFPAMDNNIQCQNCVESCASQAISRMWGTLKIDPERCNYCGNCYNTCPGDLIGIQGLDKLLVRLKRDREKGADTLYLACDQHHHGDAAGTVKLPTYRYLSPEVLFWAAALGYSRIILPKRHHCSSCQEKCYDQMLISLDIANSWLKYWDRTLEPVDQPQQVKGADRQLTRRELFAGLGWNVKREVTELVVDELEQRLTMVLPRTEQGYMRRQALKAMAVKLLPPPKTWPEIAQSPVIAENCSGCRICSKQCPTRALSYENEGLLIKPWLCNGCNFCTLSCPSKYIELQPVISYEEYFRSRRHQFVQDED